MSQQSTTFKEISLKYISEKKSICEIIPNKLYLGSAFGANNLQELKKIGITSILNITKDIENYFPNEFIYKNIFILDNPFSTKIENHLDEALEFIHEQIQDSCSSEKKVKGKCFIHCVQGSSRSASIVLFYLMKFEKLSLRDSVLKVAKSRSEIYPNQGFVKSLMKKELEWLNVKENSWNLKDMEIIKLFNKLWPKYSIEEIEKLMRENGYNEEKTKVELLKSKKVKQ
ncbi:hypothetical protein ABK040_000961 [Willaertia magna]